MNTLINKIIDSIKNRNKDFYTKEEVIKAIELFRVKENVIYPYFCHPDIAIDGFHISPKKHEFRCNGTLLHLNKKQFALMYLLMKNKGNLVSSKVLLQIVWGFNYTNNRNLNWYMAGLKRIAPDNIYNVKGKGYIWRT